MTVDPIDLSDAATQAINVYVAIKQNPASSAATLLTKLNSLIDPRSDDSIAPTSSTYVTNALAYLLARTLIVNNAGNYSIVAAYIKRNDDETDIEAVANVSGLQRGTYW